MQTIQGKTTAQSSPRVLVVDDEPVLRDLFSELVASSVDCQILLASSIAEARQAIDREPINLLVTDLKLPDGDGLSLLPQLQRSQPLAAALVVTGAPSMSCAIEALRSGAVDFIPKPFSAQQIAERVKSALEAQKQRAHREARLGKLKSAVRRLNDARHVVTKKVDLLCNDLIGAYGELSRQLDLVRVQEGYRQFVNRAVDLEQLLCHTMDWILRQIGYCNIGIWLADSEGGAQLGAYMKYTIAGETELVEALQENLLRMVGRRGFLRLRQPEAQSNLTPPELRYLTGQDIVALSCTYLGESLGALVLFRDSKTPFSDDDVAALKTACPLFALELARAVRGIDGQSAPTSDTLEEDEPQSGKSDLADWWKRGEEPPF